MDVHSDVELPDNKQVDGKAAEQDGGTRAWCTVLGGWLALFATGGYTTSFGVYQDLYTRAGTSSPSNISWIGSMQFLLVAAMGLPAGSLLDRGYFRHIIFAGTILYIFSLFMLSLAHVDKYYQLFLAQGLGAGIGTGLIYSPSVFIQAHHWRARRAMAMGIVITGSSVGGIVYPIMLNNLFHKSVGFAWGVRASAFMTLGLLIGANCLMFPPPPKPHKSEDEEVKPIRVRDVFTDKAYLITTFGGILLVMAFLYPYFYLQLFTIVHGLSPTFAFYTLTIINGASIFGRTIPNILADKLGPLNMAIMTTFGSGVLIFAMFGLKNVAGVAVFAAFYGFFSGSLLSILPPVLASFARDDRELGVRMGFGYSVSSIAYLIGPPVAGALLGHQYHWFKPILFNGIIMLASIPFFLVGRFKQVELKRTPYV